MSDGCVRLRIEAGIASVVFDRPQARNAMTWSMYQQLGESCARIQADPTVRLATFRGAGGDAFVAGTDIAQFQAFETGEDGKAYEQQIESCISQLEALPMPTIAVVEGWTIGGGLVIATACDFRIATPGSRFGVPIARTLGNCLSIGNLARLNAAFGLARVRRMLLLAEIISADEALLAGFLLQLSAPADIDAALAGLCDRLAALAPVTQRVTKEALRRLVTNNLPVDDDLVSLCYGSADFRAGVQAFVGKTAPVWTGR
jgi:enoyl-CoA hydratase